MARIYISIQYHVVNIWWTYIYIQGLKLHLDYSGVPKRRKGSSTDSGGLDHGQRDAWTTAYSTVAAGAALVAGLGMVAFLRRGGN